MRRAGQAHQKASVFGAADARPDHVVERIGRIERHVRLVLMLAEPGGHVVVTAVAVLVEDHDDGADFAMNLALIADEDPAFMPVANRFAQIDAVEQGRGERLHGGALFGQNALALFLQEAAEILDENIFGRIGTDAGAIEFADAHSPGIFSFFAALAGPGCPCGVSCWASAGADGCAWC